MPRDMTDDIKTESAAPLVYPIIFVALEFDVETTFVNSTDRNLIWNGDEYLGVGPLGQISALGETSEVKPMSISLELTGIPTTYIQEALNQKYKGRVAKVWFGFLNQDGTLISDPVLMFEGTINDMNLVEGETATVTLVASNKLERWQTPNIRRYTNEEQQKRFPGDLGLEFVKDVVEKELIWGKARFNK